MLAIKHSDQSAFDIVEAAIKQCRCMTGSFFIQANEYVIRNKGVPEKINVPDESWRFDQARDTGKTRNYRVPQHVLEFAKTILEQDDPHSFFNSLRRRMASAHNN